MSSLDHLQRKRSTSSTAAAPTSRWLLPSRPFAPLPTAASEQAPPTTQELLEHAAQFGHSFERISILSPEKKNTTGLPDTLKAGVEQLSGLSMDDVYVHYNSAKPAEVQALAYTQGTEIHVGPGQENHLAHEAWHIVQQKQKRVQPTFQMEDIAINDDEELEREAGVMGGRAGEIGHELISHKLTNVIQSGEIALRRTLKKNEQNNSIVIQCIDDKPTFVGKIKPHFKDIQAEKGESIEVDELYEAYLRFANLVGLTTEQFIILLKAKNVNPGGQGGPAQSRTLQNLMTDVLRVIAEKKAEVVMLRTPLKDSPIGASVDFNILLKKIGEGDIQEFKLDTLIDEITLANHFFSLALEIRGRIDLAAWQSIHEAYIKSIESAESKILKKLNRELNAALYILTHDQDLILRRSSLSYAIPRLSENAEFDLLFGNTKTEENILVEVQSIPDTIKKQQHGEREPLFEEEQDVGKWDKKTRDNLITYLVETMYHKRQQLSMVQKQFRELRDIPIVFLFTRPLPPRLYDALNISGMFVPVMQPGKSLSELIAEVQILFNIGTKQAKNPAKRLAVKQEEEEARPEPE